MNDNDNHEDPFGDTTGKILLFILICLALYGAYNLWLTLLTGLK
jgi:hypothetical protein